MLPTKTVTKETSNTPRFSYQIMKFKAAKGWYWGQNNIMFTQT